MKCTGCFLKSNDLYLCGPYCLLGYCEQLPQSSWPRSGCKYTTEQTSKLVWGTCSSWSTGNEIIKETAAPLEGTGRAFLQSICELHVWCQGGCMFGWGSRYFNPLACCIQESEYPSHSLAPINGYLHCIPGVLCWARVTHWILYCTLRSTFSIADEKWLWEIFLLVRL